MKTQVFKIRLDDVHLSNDQRDVDDFMRSNTVIKSESAFVASDNFWTVLLFYEQNGSKASVRENRAAKYSASFEDLNTDEMYTLNALKEWRSEQSKTEKLPTYFIASNNELCAIAKMKPQNEHELAQIKGFGRYKVENYGHSILEIIQNSL